MPTSKKKRSSKSVVGEVVGLVVLLAFVLPFLPNGKAWLEGLTRLLGVLIVVGVLAAIAWLAWRIWGRLRTPTAKELNRRFEEVRTVGGARGGVLFELFVADLFGAMGHKAVVLGGAGDQGVDVIVTRAGERIAVQCKNYKKAVGNKPVQEVYAGARHHGCLHACVVAPSGYTNGAKVLARSTGVQLFDEGSIRGWIKQVDDLARGGQGAVGPMPETGGSPAAGRGIMSEGVRESRKRAMWHGHPDDDPPRG